MDPKRPATEVTALWRPELVPTAVMLTRAPDGFPQAASLDQTILATALARSEGADGLHIRLPGDHQLWLLEKGQDQPLAVLIPLDDNFPLRAAGALRLHKLLSRKTVGPSPRSQKLTAQQRDRLIQMLIAFDAHASLATYRDIASALFGPNASSDKGWKTHPIRGKTIRLVSDAIKMVNRGYLKLLRGR